MQPLLRVNWIEEEPDKQEEEEDSHEQYLLGIDGHRTPPFMMKGKFNRKKFFFMIDSGSPVTIISHDELQTILQY